MKHGCAAAFLSLRPSAVLSPCPVLASLPCRPVCLLPVGPAHSACATAGWCCATGSHLAVCAVVPSPDVCVCLGPVCPGQEMPLGAQGRRLHPVTLGPEPVALRVVGFTAAPHACAWPAAQCRVTPAPGGPAAPLPPGCRAVLCLQPQPCPALPCRLSPPRQGSGGTQSSCWLWGSGRAGFPFPRGVGGEELGLRGGAALLACAAAARTGAPPHVCRVVHDCARAPPRATGSGPRSELYENKGASCPCCTGSRGLCPHSLPPAPGLGRVRLALAQCYPLRSLQRWSVQQGLAQPQRVAWAVLH